MQRTLISFVIVLLGTSLVFVGNLALFQGAPAYTVELFGNMSGGWTRFSHIASNGFFYWYISPILSRISGGEPLEYSAILFFVGLSGMLAFVRLSLSTALVYSFSFLFIFGSDIPVAGFVAPLPWLMLAFERASKDNHPGWILFALIVGTLSAFSAGYLAPILILISFFASEQAPREEGFNRTLACAAAALPSLFPLLLQLNFDLPSYPKFSHVVPGYGTSFGIDPLIGSHLPIPIIDREYSRHVPWVPGVIVYLIAVSIWFSSVRLKKKVRIAALGVASFLSLSVILDGELFSRAINMISPLSTIVRIIPGTVYFPLSHFILGGSIMLLILGIDSLIGSVKIVLQCLVIAALSAISLHDGFPKAPFLVAENSRELASELNALPPETRQQLQPIFNSPSLYLIRQNGLSLLSRKDAVRNTTFHEITCSETFPCQISASDNPKHAIRIVDNKPKNRWSTKLSKQTGEEWVHLYLPEPQTFSAIRLSVGKYVTDFPRGLEILIKESCSSDSTDFSEYRLIFHDKRWQGELGFTESGHPYYQAQSNVGIFLPESVSAQCILIRQIGTESFYEWTIKSILLGEKPQ